MRHVTHVNEACHTCEWGMSHIWMRHVTQHIWTGVSGAEWGWYPKTRGESADGLGTRYAFVLCCCGTGHTHTHTHMNTNTRTHTHTHAHIRTHIHTHNAYVLCCCRTGDTHVHKHKYTHTHTHSLSLSHTHTNTHTHTQTYKRACTYTTPLQFKFAFSLSWPITAYFRNSASAHFTRAMFIFVMRITTKLHSISHICTIMYLFCYDSHVVLWFRVCTAHMHTYT